ncbi:hypothetical protein [Marinobacter xestospongiae]|uniref:hypothetical protein n=1 Tax=Marinobacter xestospongiae TaxID=994319 RepID=UPI0020066FB4|nr:hypothetical protein [Marinobacter xestospongiae]MCK7566914.1 hypothetical protein [Marinobacter xestospongiae]
MKDYSVLGFYDDSGQTFCHHVQAETAQAALKCVAVEYPDACFVAVLDGHVSEGQGITFPDYELVTSYSVLEQAETYKGNGVLL